MLVRRYSLVGVVISLMLVGAVLLSGCAPAIEAGPARAGESAGRTITVVGRGEVSARPDVANTTVGVEVRAATVDAATAETEERMASILAALKSLGIAAKDIQTSNFSVSFEPDQPAAGSAGSEKPAGFFRVSNMVRVTVRDLSQVGAVLDAAIKAGANNVWGLSFGLDKTGELELQAREAAVKDAKARAQSLADLNGVSLGSVVSVSEVVGSTPGPFYADAAAKLSASGVAVEAGEITLSTQIQVVYEIR